MSRRNRRMDDLDVLSHKLSKLRRTFQDRSLDALAIEERETRRVSAAIKRGDYIR